MSNLRIDTRRLLTIEGGDGATFGFSRPSDNHGKPARRHHTILRLAVAGVAAVAVAAIAVALAFIVDPPFDASSHEIEAVIRSWGIWGIVGSMGLMVLHSLLPFPAELVAVANGMVYGPFWGTVITWTGAMLGAFFAFALTRSLGRPFVIRMIARRHWQSIDDWATIEGGRMVLLARFFPFIAFNLINYAAGLSGISWRTFAWTTGIGILPVTILLVVMGDQIHTLPWWTWLILVIMIGVVWRLFRHRFRLPVRNDAKDST